MSNLWIPYNDLTAYPAIEAFEVHNTRSNSNGTTSGQLPQSRVTLRIPHNMEDTATRRLLGDPCVWPYFATPGPRYCISVQSRPDGGKYEAVDTEKTSYDSVFLDCTYSYRKGVYRTNPYFPLALLYVEDHIEPRTELLPQDHRQFNWTSDSRAVGQDQTPYKVQAGDTLTHTVSGLQGYNLLWSRWIGMVHNQSYSSTLVGVTFEPNSLLLRSINIINEVTQSDYGPGMGFGSFTLVARFEYRDICDPGAAVGDACRIDRWNKFYRPIETNPKGFIYDTMKFKNNSAQQFTPVQSNNMMDILF